MLKLAAWALLLLLVLLLISAWRRQLTIRVTAQTEEVRVWYQGEGPRSFDPGPALVITRDTVRITSADVVLEKGVRLDFRRVHPDTVRIYLQSETGGHVGVVIDSGKVLRRLENRAFIRVLLNEGQPGRRFAFPVHARKVEVGRVHRFQSGGTQAQLRSGTVTFSERILIGHAQARSRNLQPGDQFNVPMDDRRETGAALGSISAERDGEPGMHVDLTVRGSTGQITRYGATEVLKSDFLYAVTHDPLILLVCMIIGVLLPLKAMVQDRAKEQLAPYIKV